MSKYRDAQEGFAAGTASKRRPDCCAEEHLTYLDALRKSAVTNMFGARPYLMDAFPDLSGKDAATVLSFWMQDDRHN